MELLERPRELVAELLYRPVGDQLTHPAVVARLPRQPLLLEETALLVLAAAPTRTRRVPGGLRHCHGTLRIEADSVPPGRWQDRSLQCSSIAAMCGSDLQHRFDGALREVGRLRAENERLRTLLALAQRTQTILDSSKPEPALRASSSPASADQKIGLMQRVFRGRDDVYALHWESARTGKSGYVPATAEGWNGHGPKTYLRMSYEAIERHLRGRESIGVYPLLEDDTCWFLACDLDGCCCGTSGLPAEIRCTIGVDLAIARADLPPSLLAELKHLASLHNPLFYERQRLRLSTHQTPRLIRCYEEDLTHLHLPRGLLSQVEDAVANAGSRLVTDDRRPTHTHLPLEFHGELTPLQANAAVAMLAHDDGILVAPPGTGKTVIACALIAERKLPTLILAHSKPLLEQWRVQLTTLLALSSKQIGQKGGGRRKLSRIVDLAMIQSLKAIDDLDAFFGGYGLIVIDECHHLPAFSFESAVRHAPARHFLGLTATPYRRDGLQEIVTMQCGAIRHRIASSESPAGEISLELIVRETGLAFADTTEQPIHEVFRRLVEDEQRSTLVCDDVLAALTEGRRCLVLSQWKQHCHALAERLQSRGISPLMLEGGLGKRARAALLDQIENTPPDEPLVVIATGQYLGEGFDCPQLDTLFLAFPISFKGRLVQYSGRLMRAHEGKATVRVYDYADVRVPVLRAMHARRLTTYKTLGFTRAHQTPKAAAA